MKAFVFSYNPGLEQAVISNILDNTNAVVDWVSPYRGLVILASDLTTNELAAVLQSHLNGIWYVLVEANLGNCNGWLAQNFWTFVNDPNSVKPKALMDLLGTVPPPPPKGLINN